MKRWIFRLDMAWEGCRPAREAPLNPESINCNNENYTQSVTNANGPHFSYEDYKAVQLCCHGSLTMFAPSHPYARTTAFPMAYLRVIIPYLLRSPNPNRYMAPSLHMYQAAYGMQQVLTARNTQASLNIDTAETKADTNVINNEPPPVIPRQPLNHTEAQSHCCLQHMHVFLFIDSGS